MASQELEDETLGQKHQRHNAVLQQLITTHTFPDSKLDDNDLDNLLKIDVANHNKDVDYILDVLKSDDMLYVSRALARCPWLVTDQEYANIVNPDYLQSELFPNMTTKAIHKLKKHIRLNIKDEARAEKFYLSEKNTTDALKWLPYCSIPFIESKVQNIRSLGYNNKMVHLFKRLCEKSITVFEIVLKSRQYYETQYFQFAPLVINTDVEKYLDVIESIDSSYGFPNLSPKATELIMKHSPNRIIDKIEKHFASLHKPTFVKYLKADEIKEFLYAQSKKDLRRHPFSNLRQLFKIDTLKYFIRRLPKNEQFDFVKKVCMQILPTDVEPYQMNELCRKVNPQGYVWYQFAPFEQAFEEITKMIPLSKNNEEKREMIFFLIKCADHKLQYIQTITKYFLSTHKSEEPYYKFKFVTEVLNHTYIAQYDENTWNILNDVLNSLKVNQSHTEIVNAIIVYNALNGIQTPEEIEKMFSFKTLKTYRTKMDQEQQNNIFDYIYELSLSKIKNPITDEKDFTASITTLEYILNLIQDWGKKFLDYPILLAKIRELIKIKKENRWKSSMSSLYNINKSWRKYMFEESVSLCPNEEVLLNALKHEPQLLARHAEEVDALKTNDAVSLRRIHAKLRVYWPHSLAQQWTNTYLNNINETSGQKTAVQGLCTMLAQKPLLEIIEKYKPDKPKIDWKQTDERVLSVQRLLAKNMHIGRPQPVPDAILSYAKGDYLQFALPSLLAIFYNLKSSVNKEYIPKLLDAPVSVQKHGIRHAFKTLDHEKLKQIFLNCWNSSKNTTIRTIIFKYTFTLLCKDAANATSLWEILETFIDNLTFTENKDTYVLLSKVIEVPFNIRAKFLVKSYNFLQKLIPTLDESNKLNYTYYCVSLAENIRPVMETICPEFALTIIQEFIDRDFFGTNEKFGRGINYSHGIIRVISAYLLHARNENDQLEKYEKVMVPLMNRSFEKWSERRDGNYFVRRHFRELLKCLSYDLKDYVVEKKMIVPLKMYSLIQVELEKTLPINENYLMITEWKLTIALAGLAQLDASVEKAWDGKCGLDFGKICLEYLKNDVSLHFPAIYVLFSRSVKEIMTHILTKKAMLQFYEGMLSDKDFIPGYLSSIEIGMGYRNDKEFEQIWKQVISHSSVEVKMHYYSKIEEKSL